MDQKQWITRALDGDRTARAHLFEENISPIYYLCWKLTGSAAQAGELTRRTFARAFSSLTQLRPDASFDRWVIAIAVNLCRQSMKKSQPWLFSTDEREMAVLRDTYVADEECLPPECATDPEMRSAALRTIGLLPPEQRICMVLRYAALLKPHQIAKIMDVDELTILGRLNSGRRALMTSLPSVTPQALVTELFTQEAAMLPVPELLRGSCMQTVLNAEPEQELPAEPEPEEEPEEKPAGLFANMDKKQKWLLFGGGGLALILVILILVLALRGCSSAKAPEPELPEPEPAPVEEIDNNLEAEAMLNEYGVEVLLTQNRRDAEKLIEDWTDALREYVSSGNPEDLALDIETENDAVTEVRLSLAYAELDITRLRDLSLGVNPELSAAADAIRGQYKLACYDDAPLFEPVPRTHDSMAAYSENYRYELIDEDSDGRADTLSITRTGAGFDLKTGVFRPYGESLLDLLGLRRDDAMQLLGEGSYEGEDVDLYSMATEGDAADGSEVSITAVMEARSEMDAARQTVTALTLDVDGCFAELLPELQLPDSALSLTQLSRKLESMPGHMGLLEGDVFAPMLLESGDDYLAYYEDSIRYIFIADGTEAPVEQVEVLDLSDCRLWDARGLSFRLDGFDLEKLLGLDRYQAYGDYGIRSYPTQDLGSQALGLWESNGAIRTVYDSADPRALWGLHVGDSRENIEAKVESDKGYICSEDENTCRYVLSGKRELVVSYSDGRAMSLQLEDHSYDSGYQAPEPKKKSPQELFTEFLAAIPDAKASWYGDLTHNGVGDLLVCRSGGSGCLLQLYTANGKEVSATPVYTKTIGAGDSTDVYIVDHESGPALLLYSVSENFATSECRWTLMSISSDGRELTLGQNEAGVDLLDLLVDGQEAYDAVKQEAEAMCEKGTYLCGTQKGAADFSDKTADLSE